MFRLELLFLCMLVIYRRLIAHTLHLLNPKSTWLSAAIVIFVDMGEVEICPALYARYSLKKVFVLDWKLGALCGISS